VLEDADTALQEACLEYWSECAHQALQDHEGAPTLPTPVIVPCALYACSAIVMDSAAIGPSSRLQPWGHFEEMTSCDATISPGDLVSVSETGYDLPHHCQVPRQWYLVHRVDLLFARLLVSRCSAPPLPWKISNEEQPSELKHWIEISKLWHVIVSSRIDGALHTKTLRYPLLSPLAHRSQVPDVCGPDARPSCRGANLEDLE
jgi:hypothetical protein